MEKRTKEQLIKDVALLEDKVALAESTDATRRTTMSKLLGSVKYENSYGYSSKEEKIVVLSWPEIYFKLGGLMERQTRLNYVSNVEDLQMRVRELEINRKEDDLKSKMELP